MRVSLKKNFTQNGNVQMSFIEKENVQFVTTTGHVPVTITLTKEPSRSYATQIVISLLFISKSSSSGACEPTSLDTALYTRHWKPWIQLHWKRNLEGN